MVITFFAIYGLLWLLTQFAGVSDTRATVLRSMRGNAPISSSWTDASLTDTTDLKSPYYYCRTSAYAPFVVRADYGWVSGPLNGDGGGAWYVWFFGHAFRVYEFKHWMA